MTLKLGLEDAEKIGTHGLLGKIEQIGETTFVTISGPCAPEGPTMNLDAAVELMHWLMESLPGHIVEPSD